MEIVEGEKRRRRRDCSRMVGSEKKSLVFAYYVTGHGFGHATRVIEVLLVNLSCYPLVIVLKCN